jgi:tRNA threonylcarbamoyladenosine biosynthesis protein TsaE
MSGIRQAVVESVSPADTLAIARAFAAAIAGIDGRVVVSLEGDLGAGKTLFARGLCEGLGVGDPITSPTYVIRHDHAAADGRPVFHVDAFRVDDAREIDALVLDDARRADAIVLVEWGDKVAAALPAAETIRVRIESRGEMERRIRFEYPQAAEVE